VTAFAPRLECRLFALFTWWPFWKRENTNPEVWLRRSSSTSNFSVDLSCLPKLTMQNDNNHFMNFFEATKKLCRLSMKWQNSQISLKITNCTTCITLEIPNKMKPKVTIFNS